MTRLTLDYGIDLGTTNSVICRLNGVLPDVIRNDWNLECTPSVVMMNKTGELIVGRTARARQEFDPDNVTFEFKLKMGEDWQFTFAQTGRKMKPEELSAEVLKELRRTAAKRTGEEISGAVITVPAAFDYPQTEATNRAAAAAGLTAYPLLLEPVAAALAYGFQSDSDRVYWLTYDFGGGTFDAALINMRDGIFNVVNHLGDNELGGKLLDWEIVNRVFIPQLVRDRKLSDFRRGNPHWRAAIGKLKVQAEEAKIRLSNEQTADVHLDFLCNDDRGEPVVFDCEVSRRQMEDLAEPYIRRTIEKSRETLRAKGIGPGDVERVLLVGGATLMPLVREWLADTTRGLGIALAQERDPMTVVAQGAAIFAGNWRIEPPRVAPRPPGGEATYTVELLNYRPVDSTSEPLIGGRVTSAETRDLTGLTIEFADTAGTWRSGARALHRDGSFTAALFAGRDRQNIYLIELRDGAGRLLPVAPDRLSYRIGATSEASLTHSVGVALANNTVNWFARKGEPVPLPRRKLERRAAIDVEPGQELHIPIMTGENERADRNEEVGRVVIGRTEPLTRRVPAGSDVEILLAIDQSGIITVNAFIPVLNREFPARIEYNLFRTRTPALPQLGVEAERERDRLKGLRVRLDEADDAAGRAAMERFAVDSKLQDLERALHNASATGHDEDARNAFNRLRELQCALDEVETVMEVPLLIARARNEIEVERSIINGASFKATPEEKGTFARLEREIQRAIQARDKDVLRLKTEELDRLGHSVYWRSEVAWVTALKRMEERQPAFADRATAVVCFNRGNQAINHGDLEGLKEAVRQLWRLLPAGEEQRLKYDSGLI